MSENGPSVLWQLPFFRLCVGGRGAVAIFFLITGFVNSINPVKNARAGNTGVALTNLARSSFTRSGRLVVPTTIAMTIGFVMCQTGLLQFAYRVDSDWIRGGGRNPDPLGIALKKLVKTCTIYWSNGGAEYDGTHWTLAFFLKGSFRVYLALLAMTLTTPRSWRLINVFLYLYSWCTSDFLVGINIYAGLMLAQLHVDLGPRATQILPKPVPSLLMILGAFIWSYPQDNPHWRPWSKFMQDVGVAITPGGSETSRCVVSVGITIFIYGVFFSRNARRVLTSPVFNFLGRVSFPVYLMHAMLMRTVLSWMVYGQSASKLPVKDDKGNLIMVTRVAPGWFFLIMPAFFAILWSLAYLWTLYVDPFCGKVVDWLKNRMFVDDQLPQEKPIPLTTVA